MSFVRHHISLHETEKQPVHKFKPCAKCGDMRPPEGGVQMNQTKWYCAACWTLRATSNKRNAK